MAHTTAAASQVFKSSPPQATQAGKPRSRKYRESARVKRDKLSPGASQLQREVLEAVMSSPRKGRGGDGDEVVDAGQAEKKAKKRKKRASQHQDDEAAAPAQDGEAGEEPREKSYAENVGEFVDAPKSARKSRRAEAASEQAVELVAETGDSNGPINDAPLEGSAGSEGRKKLKRKQTEDETAPLMSITPTQPTAKRTSKKQKLYGKSPARPPVHLDSTQDDVGDADGVMHADVMQDVATEEIVEPVRATPDIPRNNKKRRRNSGTKAKHAQKSAKDKLLVSSAEMQGDEPIQDYEAVAVEDGVGQPHENDNIEQPPCIDNEDVGPPYPDSPRPPVEVSGRESGAKKSKRTRHKMLDENEEVTEPSSTKKTPKPKKTRKLQAEEPMDAEEEEAPKPSTGTKNRSAKKQKKSATPKAGLGIAKRLPPVLGDELPTSGPFTATEVGRMDLAVRMFRDELGLSEIDFNNLVQARDRYAEHAGELWNALSEALPHRLRKAIQNTCRRRYHNFDQRGKFTEEDDEMLKELMITHPAKWTYIGAMLDRLPDDCKDRWRNYVTCGDNRVTDYWTQGEEIELERAVNECKDAIVEDARLKAEENDEPFVFPDWQGLLNFATISEKMGRKRSRIQCYQHYKAKQKREESHRGSVDESNTVSGSPKANRRTAIALGNYHRMLVGDKLEILQSILQTDTFDEEFIPWKKIKEFTPDRRWTTRDRKVAFEKMKALVTRKEDMGETVKALIRYFTKRYPDSLGDFYDAPESKKVPRLSRRSTVGKDKLPRSAEYLEGSEDDETAKELGDDPIISDGADGVEDAGDADEDHAEDMSVVDQEDSIERSPSIENGRRTSVDDGSVADDLEDIDMEDTESVPDKSVNRRPRSISLGREETTYESDVEKYSVSNHSNQHSEDDEVDNTFQDRRSRHSGHSFRSSSAAPPIEETPAPDSSNVADLDGDLTADEEDSDLDVDVKSEPASDIDADFIDGSEELLDGDLDTGRVARSHTVDLDGNEEQGLLDDASQASIADLQDVEGVDHEHTNADEGEEERYEGSDVESIG